MCRHFVLMFGGDRTMPAHGIGDVPGLTDVPGMTTSSLGVHNQFRA